jgi:hypothetical protein
VAGGKCAVEVRQGSARYAIMDVVVSGCVVVDIQKGDNVAVYASPARPSVGVKTLGVRPVQVV